MQDPEEMEPIEAPQEIVIPTDWGAIVSALLVLLGGGYVLGWHGILSPDPGDGYISLKSFAASFMLAVLTLPVLIILLGERSVRFRRTPEALLVQRLRLVGGGVAHEVQYEWEKVERFEYELKQTETNRGIRSSHEILLHYEMYPEITLTSLEKEDRVEHIMACLNGWLADYHERCAARAVVVPTTPEW